MASKPFPGFTRVYTLDEGSYSTFRGDIALDDQFAVTRAEQTPPGPVEVRWAMGRAKPSDIIHTTSVTPLLVSSRVVGILEAGQFSGWRTYPVSLFGKAGARIPGYHGLAVHGRCGPIDNTRSLKVDSIYPGGIFPTWRGLLFDPATWDGSDLFMPAGEVGWILVVDAVKRALEKARVTNVRFTSLDARDRPDMWI